MRGASVFTLSEKASDKEAAAVAERENKSDLVAGVKYTTDPEVNEILFDLARRQTNNLSLRLAQQLVVELGHNVTLLRNHPSLGGVRGAEGAGHSVSAGRDRLPLEPG